MPYTLTPSNLNLFKQCKRCFWLQLNENKKRPDAIYPSLPFGVDKVLKTRFDYFRDKGKLPAELRKLGKNIKLCDHPLIGMWKNNFKGIQWKDERGNVLKGAVDDVLEKKSGDESRNGSKLIVLEYVTRGFPLKEDTASYYQDRLDLYSFLLKKNGFETEDFAYLLFYHPKDVNWRGDLWFNKELHKIDISVENAEKLFQEAISVLESDCPPKNTECGFCKWQEG